MVRPARLAALALSLIACASTEAPLGPTDAQSSTGADGGVADARAATDASAAIDAGTFIDAGATDDAGAACGQPPTVEGEVLTTEGVIRGRDLGPDRGFAFLGVPFAAPPVDDLRWRAPEAPSCHRETLVTDAVGPVCPQIDEQGTPLGDEDCLQLNVWTPAPGAGSSPRPVMVFIHGGGNVQGSASAGVQGDLLYDGAPLSAARDVIVVTIQYRLGALGWWLDDESGATGNYGTLDQIRALEWIRDNATAFGGDPDRVMIFGESAGGRNVCVLVASPRAAGLFSAAAMQSGACVVPAEAKVREEGAALLAASGCDQEADKMACMRARSPRQLLEDFPPLISVAGLSGSLQPWIDSDVLMGQPEAEIAAGRHNPVPFIIGSNSDETSRSVPRVADADAFEALTRASFGPFANQVLAAYPLADFDTPTEAWIAITTDSKFTCTARRATRAAAAGQSQPVYRYHFRQGLTQAPRIAAFGAYHGADLFFVFQRLDIANYAPSPAEAALSELMGGYWAGMAEAGDPNHPGAPAWPLYEASSDRTLVLEGDAVRAEDGIRTARCDFWDSFTPN